MTQETKHAPTLWNFSVRYTRNHSVTGLPLGELVLSGREFPFGDMDAETTKAIAYANNACNAHDELVDYIYFSCMFPAINSSQQIKLEAAAMERGWDMSIPVETFLGVYRARVLAKARGEA